MLDGYKVNRAIQTLLSGQRGPEAEKRQIRARLDALRSPFRSAEKFYVEEIVQPAETRRWLTEFATLAQRPAAAPPRGFHCRP